MRRAIATLLVSLMTGAVVACGANKKPPTTTTTTAHSTTAASATTSSTTVSIAPGDEAACALLYARLERVTTALSTASELIAHSVNKRQLSDRIAVERVQLQRSARLMNGGPVPAPLQGADRQLVLALDAFSGDFARAERPALHGDFRAAAQAMSDRPVVQQILAASTKIEDACRGAG